MRVNQVETAARRRQQVLDFLIANPGARMAAIGAALFGETASRSRHHNTVHTMIEWGEVVFTGVARCRQYWANVTTTRPAIDVQQARETGIRRKNAKVAAEAVEAARRANKSCRGVYVHIPCQDKHGRPGEGGQGALRRTVYVNCQQFY